MQQSPSDVSGFNPSAPEIIPLSGETIEGASGQEYSSYFVAAVTLSNLYDQFSGYDFSPYQNVDPNSIVYVFKTNVPIAEIRPVPLPASIVLFVSTISCMFGFRLRQTNKA